ncbi:MAG: acyl-CoA synthetase [Burkholderiales bacterium]|nr:acyl-CoA synthetase [Burkholderiales bacterium]
MSATQSLIRTIADVEAFERIPLEERPLAWTLPEVLDAGAALDPCGTALHYLREANPDETALSLTYAELMGKVRQTANLLRRLFQGHEGVAGVLLPLVPENYFLLCGAPMAGILCPVNWAMKASQIAGILTAAGAEVLVTLGPCPGFDIWETARDVLELTPGIRHVIQVRGPGGTAAADREFGAMIAAERADALSFERELRPENTAIYCATGGTTGLPKLARLSHRGIAYKCHAYHWVLGHGPGEVWLAGTPLFHSGGIVNRTFSALSHGVTVVITSAHGYRAPATRTNHWKLIEKYRVTEISAPPTLLAALIDLPAGGADLSSLQKFANTGSMGLPVATARAFEEKFGVSIRANYGLTENTASACLSPRWGPPRYGASGIRLPYTKLKTVIVDRAGAYLRDGAPGEPGVIAVKGPGVTAGYVDESQNRALFFPGGWLNTGDLGRIDEDGYIWVTGRIKDLIIRGGNNIDASLIDETLMQHPAVEIAAAVGRPDSYAGELPVAYVQLRAGASAGAEEIREFARKHIPERGAAPVAVHILERLPLTDVGKISKPPLRCDAAQREFEAALAPLCGAGVSASVEVADTPAAGMRARIQLACADGARDAQAEDRARTIMSAYAFAYEIDWKA